MVDNILYIGGVAGAIVAILGLIVKVAKPIKSISERFDGMESGITELKSSVSELKDEVAQLKSNNSISDDALRAVLRNNITNMYYKNVDSETLREYEFEEMIQACECYFKLGGNSYVKELYERMCGWKVVS